MQLHNLALALQIEEAVRAIHRNLYRKSAPDSLHHYTKPETLEKIIDSRVLWATSVADQEDQTEITHAAKMLASATEKVIASGLPTFTSDVLRRLAHFMEERKSYTFIACFCERPDSARHWNHFGKYRITLAGPGSRTDHLSCTLPKSDFWYQQVIYDEKLQARAITESVQAVVGAIACCSSGDVDGPIRNWFVDSCARNAGQIILSMAVGFKSKKYRWEKEWRIVCCPRLGANSSSPNSDDEDFMACVQKKPRNHVPLQVSGEMKLFEPVMRPIVPFNKWQTAPNHSAEGEMQMIRDALIRNHRLDLLEPTSETRSLVPHIWLHDMWVRRNLPTKSD